MRVRLGSAQDVFEHGKVAIVSRLHFRLDSPGRAAQSRLGRLQRTPAQRPARAP